MKPVSLLGISLVVVGALVLAYQGMNYTRQKKVIDVGSVHVTTETRKHIPLSNIWRVGIGWRGGPAVMGAKNR